jgi:hypothetical protein
MGKKLGVPAGQTKDHKIGSCCFSAKQAASRSNNKDMLAQNQDNELPILWSFV